MAQVFSKGYLDSGYLAADGISYLGGQIGDGVGQQFQGQINDFEDAKGSQFQGQILDSSTLGAEFQGKINDSDPIGTQFQGEIADTDLTGTQFQGTILDDLLTGLEFEGNIIDSAISGVQFDSKSGIETDLGLQFQGKIDAQKLAGVQFASTMEAQEALGAQFLGQINDALNPLGLQYQAQIVEQEGAYGIEFKIDVNLHTYHAKYLVETEGYLEYGYLAEKWCVFVGTQFNAVLAELEELGVQFEGNIVDQLEALGIQFDGTILDQLPVGVQFDSVTASTFGVQFNIALYNTTNLRILCEFPSRGSEVTGGGNNAWGNPIGTGQNWDVTSGGTAAGDFDVDNINTDIVEQVYRSTSTSVVITCDTEETGNAIDTLAILGHNLTQGASVTFIAATDAAFSNVVYSKSISPYPTNMYYFTPNDEFPPPQARYYRISITDGSNPDGYIQLGTVIFGAGRIFQGECMVDEISFELRDFADTVETEGFTNVAVSRAQKRILGLDFRSLNYNQFGNFDILREVFTGARTVLKCLWIPTPSIIDQGVTDRYAVFGKLTQVPVERHNSKGPNNTYVTMSVEVDESK